MKLKTLALLALLAPAASPQSGPPGGLVVNPPPALAGSGVAYDPTAPGTWGLPMVGGYGCIPWPIFPPPFPVPLPWWGP